jgi:hypothetical protein
MADHTRRFWLTTLDQPTDEISLNNYKFTDSDRVMIDRLLRFAVENHVHTGQIVTTTRPLAPTLLTHPIDGAIPGNTTVHYRYSIVDERGQESIASQVATIQTASQASAPAFAPRLTRQAGTLDGGEYLYAVSACTNEATQETLISPMGAGTLTGFGGWHVDLPPMPNGGQFFNVYRKAPTDTELVYLFTTGPEDRWFIDDGDRQANRFRTSPTANTTNMTNQVGIELPNESQPGDSWTWKIYRTYDVANWDNSLLDWVGSNDYYVDDGRATRPGYPPETSAAVGGAPKIRLGPDTTGAPPTTTAAGVTRIVNFNADTVQVGPGTWHWVNEYQHAELVSMRATVNRINPPTVYSCLIGLDRLLDVDWVTVVHPWLWPVQPMVCAISVGTSVGDSVSLNGVGPPLPRYLRPGERLRLHAYQMGYEPGNADHDLSLAVTLRVHDGLSNQSYVWETS